jgi:hypothetical protein
MLWKACNTRAACWEDYLNAACSMVSENRDRRWVWKQMRMSSGHPRDPLTDCSESLGQQSVTRQYALTLMGGHHSLQVAASYGDRQIVEALLRSGADPNASSDYYDPALYIAAYSGQTEIVGLLLDWPVDVNCEGYLGTPLEAAAHEGHADIMELLFEKGVDLVDNGKALLYASEGGHGQAVDLLLARPDIGDVYSRNAMGQTPLLLAAQKGHRHVTGLLLMWPDINQIDSVLFWACHWGWDWIVEGIIRRDEAACKIEAKYYLWWAATKGKYSTFSSLLKHYRGDVDPYGFDKFLESLLMTSLSLSESHVYIHGYERVVRMLVRRPDVGYEAVLQTDLSEGPVYRFLELNGQDGSKACCNLM